MADQHRKSDEEADKGIARIKPEFIVLDHVPHLAEGCLSNADKEKFSSSAAENANKDGEKCNETPETEKAGAQGASTEKCDPNSEGSLEPPSKKRLSKSEKKKLRGQNKARPPPFKVNREIILCHTLVDIVEGEEPVPCSNNRCTNMHDVKAFMAIRPRDIGTTCYNFETRGRCPRGLTCRYGSSHISQDGFNKVNKTLWESYCSKPPPTQNVLSKELQVSLRKRTYDFKISEKVLEESKVVQSSKGTKRTIDDEVKVEIEVDNTTASAKIDGGTKPACKTGPVSDEDIIKPRIPEKKTIVWRGKLALSPLTTVGNLPFRRICKEFGVDITCGEMAMAVPLLQGMTQEWALVKKHESEDIFGVQLCGNNPYTMTKCAQVLQENMQIDFIDINMGCPIDLVYREGGGSGLLHREKVLQSIVRSMNKVMTIPLTVKTRTGIVMGKNIAHNFMPYFRDLGASLITVHGRSREQRYTRSADWDYIDECAKIAHPVPLFGNGDILSYEDYKHVTEKYENIAGVMVGRGALIKPWIFTEIKEKRLWDISSRERLDILKKYVNYGLEHWGSDTKGVESTRRFLLEWLSFLHRYIPVGILERPPQKINERPPVFKGRDHLETLMASPNCAHWIEISEMLLGPVPEGFHFLPKHKANSWK
ncbi:tRNA-dihydrouridine(47) synthase [NAD(P)(+)]-like [Frankliniella fusca]|uniref:tRNA-dihydrouridine(47) synthase [NAD(P)(+)] n=1 Tax=Frankliniella fusca TaxID=407009 RepID=A0AAE1H783_9NEOP|nr:tRNA-dihydrouridine(47) synthase [NAD(P)(+)]-like [Frankliniella fusca]